MNALINSKLAKIYAGCSVLPFIHPFLVKCASCERVFKRRSKRNEPVYCSYDCGASRQKTAMAMKNDTSGRN